MKIRITIEAIDDEDHIVSSKSGEIDASGSVSSGLTQWFMETFTAVRMDAIFSTKKDK